MVHNVLGPRRLGFLMNDTGRDFEFNLPSTHTIAEVNTGSPENHLRLWTLELASRLSGLRTTEDTEILVNDHAPGGHHTLHWDSVRLHMLIPQKLLGMETSIYASIFPGWC